MSMRGADPIAVLTHDVDKITETRKHIWSVRARFSKADLLRGLISPSYLYKNLRETMDLEAEHGVKSTFFIPTDLYRVEEIEDECKRMSKEGWEIAYHLVYDDYLRRTHDFQYVMDRKRRLEALLEVRIRGVRNHFLMHFGSKTFDMQKRAGFLYDSSLRASDAGGRAPFEPVKGMLEIPITLMDSDMWGKLKLSEKAGWKLIQNALNEASRDPAKPFVFNAHPCSLRMRGGRLYRDLVKEIANRGFKVLRCSDLANLLRRGAV
jgi:peptidoglycan/xylan/chitin deacetylase (PgdA/CDA1 family)